LEKTHSRRNFIIKASVLAGFSQIPLTGWSAGFVTLLNVSVNPQSEFSLLKLEMLLPGYQFPFIDQFSTVAFQSEYKLYNLYGDRAMLAGEFFIRSEMKGKSRHFNFSNWRLANNSILNKNKKFKYFVSGKIKCKPDLTLSPEAWKVFSRIALLNDGSAYRGTGIKNIGVAKEGEIVIKNLPRPITKSYGQMPLSWKWGLLSVVQNMAVSSIQELHFSSLDEFDMIYKKQVIRFRRKVRIDCGNQQMVDFKIFELTGNGVIPTVYWVDNLNRTVFIISGMEAFVFA
jgi:hypothetical protein